MWFERASANDQFYVALYKILAVCLHVLHYYIDTKNSFSQGHICESSAGSEIFDLN